MEPEMTIPRAVAVLAQMQQSFQHDLDRDTASAERSEIAREASQALEIALLALTRDPRRRGCPCD